YSTAERASNAAFDATASVAGAMIGEIAGDLLRTGVLLFGAPIALGVVAPAWIGTRLGSQASGAGSTRAGSTRDGGSAAKSTGIAGFLVKHPQLTSNPRFVAGVRGLADGLDEGLVAGSG
ncbi:hypothetical protein, partial [Mesorhizobium japonicum]|uniref:hypothetical protein n=1 Tax=Mesorhizobium japonicum TaxID=2066070 RepID=UPI003B5CDE7A